jgi:AcrR family transcriptional regulator
MQKRRVNTFLKECMADALIALMADTPIQKITVERIAALAGVGRATWFRNFKDKADALSFKLGCLWERWADGHNLPKERRLYTPEIAAEFFAFNYATRDLYALIYREGQQTAIYDAFYAIIMSQSKEDADACYQGQFFAYGLFGMLNEWIRRDFAESPEYITTLFFRSIRKQDLSVG